MIRGILFSQDETGEEVQCGFCQNYSNEGFDIEPETNDEREFIKYLLQDESNWCVNQCCIRKLQTELDKKSLRFIISKNLDFDNIQPEPADMSSNFLNEIDSQHEFYIIKTKNKDVIWGFLFDYDSSHLQLNNCRRLGSSQQKWIPFGNVDGRAKNWIDVSLDDIVSIKKAPYFMKDPKDYGMIPFKDKN